MTDSKPNTPLPLGCRLRVWHAWSAWQDYATGEHFFAGQKRGLIVVQIRRCTHCEAASFRKVKS